MCGRGPCSLTRRAALDAHHVAPGRTVSKAASREAEPGCASMTATGATRVPGGGMSSIVGIDVAKAKLAIGCSRPTGKRGRRPCANTAAGHADLILLATRHAARRRGGPGSDGGYQEAVALALHDAGHHVSVLNPCAVAAYGQSQLRRAKTDPHRCGADRRLRPHAAAPAVGTAAARSAAIAGLGPGGSMRCSRCRRKKRIGSSSPPRSCGHRSRPPSRICTRRSPP